jgi:hypothetical protein
MRMGRMHVELRGMVTDEDEAIRLGEDGTIVDYALRGTGPQGDVAETFRASDGTATWKSQFDAGSAAYTSPAFYCPAGWDINATHLIFERLVAKQEDVALLPGGKARTEELARYTVGEGTTALPLKAWAITGIKPSS